MVRTVALCLRGVRVDVTESRTVPYAPLSYEGEEYNARYKKAP